MKCRKIDFIMKYLKKQIVYNDTANMAYFDTIRIESRFDIFSSLEEAANIKKQQI